MTRREDLDTVKTTRKFQKSETLKFRSVVAELSGFQTAASYLLHKRTKKINGAATRTPLKMSRRPSDPNSATKVRLPADVLAIEQTASKSDGNAPQQSIKMLQSSANPEQLRRNCGTVAHQDSSTAIIPTLYGFEIPRKITRRRFFFPPCRKLIRKIVNKRSGSFSKAGTASIPKRKRTSRPLGGRDKRART